MSDKIVAPIKPGEVGELKEQSFPPEVLEAFNELIVLNFKDGSALVLQDAVLELIAKKGISREQIFANHWLDVENLYYGAGWDVYYDCPAFGDNHVASFKFSKGEF